jgi:hypothetical protein
VVNSPEFLQYAVDFQQSILQRADVEESERFRPEAFTERVIELLEGESEIEDVTVVSFRQRGMEVSAFSAIPDEGRLNLFVTIYHGTVPPPTVSKDQIAGGFSRLRAFAKAAFEGIHARIEEAAPVFDAALTIHEMKGRVGQMGLYVITDGVTHVDHVPEQEFDGIPVNSFVWDLRKIYQFETSGRTPDPIDVDLAALAGGPLPCLASTVSMGADYRAFLALLPGTLLAKVYELHGARLLERNVRTFLQARGKVNRGIRDTIRNEPRRFLAYNNGITATAETVELVESSPAVRGIVRLRNLQIVNGGQTTASLFHAAVREHEDLSDVQVQAKIIEVPGRHLDELVPKISRYANSQNRISESDFLAGDPFHIAIERFSRSVWAPASSGGQVLTRWFYERARGQYQDMKARETSAARQREFVRTHPNSQRFTKTDLAKFENTWAQLPHLVSLGAQKNFAEFTVRLRARGSFEPDELYFKRLVSKGILFRAAEKIVQAQRIPGYRANIVTYALAYLAHRTAQRINLDAIWARQAPSGPLGQAIGEVATQVREVLLDAPGGGNVTEWAKSERCWDRVREGVALRSLGAVEADLIPEREQRESPLDRGIETVDRQDMANIQEVSETGFETWFQLARWARQTGNLEAWQRSIAFSIGTILRGGRTPSRRQSQQGVRILSEARRLGFLPAADTAD